MSIDLLEFWKRLHRDPSMMSRLYAAYAAQRDTAREATLKRALAQ